MKTNKNTIIIILSALVIGLLLGWLIFGGSESSISEEHDHEHVAEEVDGETIWTCSMHPQIRQNEPGDCPLCGMDLIPLEEEQNDEIDPAAISMSPTAMKLANIQTALVGSSEPVKEIRLNGKIQEDERLVFSQSSHISGRIEELMVNFTGDFVQKGEVIATIYSPDLVTAQEELFEAQKIKETQPQLFEAAKEKLKNWRLSETQIEEILASGAAKENFEIRADVSGYVSKKIVNTGDYVKRGEAIYEIADLSKVWVLFDVYESELAWIKKGDKIEFTVESLPGKKFEGTIDYIDPLINPRTRVAKARIIKSNSDFRLKPEMFVSGKLQAKLPETNVIAVPKSAVMWTGKRSVVYVKSSTEQGVYFRMREIEIGPALGESYVVNSGLEAGEEIAIHGTFSIDAAAQLAGKPSMMSPDGHATSTGHNHDGMMMQTSMEESEAVMEPVETDPKFKAQLTKVYETYLPMKDAFVESEAAKASTAAQKVADAIEQVDMTLLKGDAHMAWMDQLNVLNKSVETIQSEEDIEKQREAFSNFNNAFYKSLKMFGLANDTAYYQYCPMAFDDQGAYWFSDVEEIRNPYFGDMMLTCGEVKEVIK